MTEALARGWDVSFFHTKGIAHSRGLPTINAETIDQAIALEKWIQEKANEHELPLHCSQNVRRVQVIDILAGKGNTLAELARTLGIPNHQVLAIGDSTNDLSMLDGRFGFQRATLRPICKTLYAQVAGMLRRRKPTLARSRRSTRSSSRKCFYRQSCLVHCKAGITDALGVRGC